MLKNVAVNQHSVFFAMRAVIPYMEKAGGGAIVNISSISGKVGVVTEVAYCASKFGVTGLTKGAALELGKYNIRVNCVCPGIVNTPMLQQDDTQDSTQSILNTLPIKRLAEPGEVTNVVLFLASDEASYVTGADYAVDAGYTAQ